MAAFKIQLGDAVTVAQELGLKSADRKPAAEVKEFLVEKIKGMTDEEKGEVDHDRFDDLAECVEKGKDFEVVAPGGEGNEPAKAATAKTGKGKPAAKAATAKTDKGKPAAKAATAKIATDKLGARQGTRAAKINAVLSKKPQTVKDITEKSGASAVLTHLVSLLRKGLVVRTEDKKYAIKA